MDIPNSIGEGTYNRQRLNNTGFNIQFPRGWMPSTANPSISTKTTAYCRIPRSSHRLTLWGNIPCGLSCTKCVLYSFDPMDRLYMVIGLPSTPYVTRIPYSNYWDGGHVIPIPNTSYCSTPRFPTTYTPIPPYNTLTSDVRINPILPLCTVHRPAIIRLSLSVLWRKLCVFLRPPKSVLN